VPVPKVKDLIELNNLLQEACEQDKERTIAGQSESVIIRWQVELSHLLRLPNQACHSTCILRLLTVKA
jgi:hypothetical protein